MSNYRFPSKPAKISNVLQAAMRAYRIDKKILQYNFVLNWKEIVGEELSEICKPQSISGETLFISVPSSAWAQELSFQSRIILGRLQKYLNDGQKVSEVRFRVETPKAS